MFISIENPSSSDRRVWAERDREILNWKRSTSTTRQRGRERDCGGERDASPRGEERRNREREHTRLAVVLVRARNAGWVATPFGVTLYQSAPDMLAR